MIMKKHTLNITFLASLICFAGARAEDTYTVDPVHSYVGFSISHMVINNVKGKFKDFSGAVVVDGSALKEAHGSIQTKSVDTSNQGRDQHLRSPDFFDAEKFPEMTFKSKRVDVAGGKSTLVGDFTMHGVTKEVSLAAKLSGPIKDPQGKMRVGLKATGELSRKDFGMTFNKTMETGGLIVGDSVELEINAEAVMAAGK
jgi:polyisoprenoid-binding protein YceI